MDKGSQLPNNLISLNFDSPLNYITCATPPPPPPILHIPRKYSTLICRESTMFPDQSTFIHPQSTAGRPHRIPYRHAMSYDPYIQFVAFCTNYQAILVVCPTHSRPKTLRLYVYFIIDIGIMRYCGGCFRCIFRTHTHTNRRQIYVENTYRVLSANLCIVWTRRFDMEMRVNTIGCFKLPIYAKRTGLIISYCRHNVRLIVMQVKAGNRNSKHYTMKVYRNMFSFTQYSLVIFEYCTNEGSGGMHFKCKAFMYIIVYACRCGALSKQRVNMQIFGVNMDLYCSGRVFQLQ